VVLWAIFGSSASGFVGDVLCHMHLLVFALNFGGRSLTFVGIVCLVLFLLLFSHQILDSQQLGYVINVHICLCPFLFHGKLMWVSILLIFRKFLNFSRRVCYMAMFLTCLDRSLCFKTIDV
jgi:hypothetical protein